MFKKEKTLEIIDAKTAKLMAITKQNEKIIKDKEKEQKIKNVINECHQKSIKNMSQQILDYAKTGNLKCKIYAINLKWINGMFNDECKELTNRLIKTFSDLGFKIEWIPGNPKGRYLYSEFGHFVVEWSGNND